MLNKLLEHFDVLSSSKHNVEFVMTHSIARCSHNWLFIPMWCVQATFQIMWLDIVDWVTIIRDACVNKSNFQTSNPFSSQLNLLWKGQMSSLPIWSMWLSWLLLQYFILWSCMRKNCASAKSQIQNIGVIFHDRSFELHVFDFFDTCFEHNAFSRQCSCPFHWCTIQEN